MSSSSESSDARSQRGGSGGLGRGGWHHHWSGRSDRASGQPSDRGFQRTFGSPFSRGRGGSRGTRGSFHGFGGRTSRWKYGMGTSTHASSPEPPLGSIISTLSGTQFNETARKYESTSSITDCMTVASYNWLDRAEPTIVIPGKPAKWTPLVEPRQLKVDDGQYFRDPNAARYPAHPMEPTILAILAHKAPETRVSDVVACGSTLGNLLRFIRGEDGHFRILVELVEGAVFFIRRENSPRELIPDVKGYGHSFPEAYTTWDTDVKGSVSHQRVISYRFGGLGFLVRFEGDGYILDDATDSTSCVLGPPAATDGVPKGADDGLAAALGQSRVTAVAAADGAQLRVLPGGNLIRQECLFELKTRSIRRKEAATFEDTFGDQLPRLWVAQVPKFILAYHDHGVFEDINVKDAKDDVQVWERKHVDILSRLAALIHHIIELAKSRPNGKLELRHVVAGALEVREQLADAGDALSDAARALWAEERDTSDGVESERQPTDLDEDDEDWDEGSDQGSDLDFTACSADDCGYCGRCSY